MEESILKKEIQRFTKSKQMANDSLYFIHSDTRASIYESNIKLTLH